MKKILAIVTMAAMVAGAAFADPEADFKIAEITGNASVTWGVDLDNSTTGFKNDVGGALKINFSNEGNRITEGDGIWAELNVKATTFQAKNETLGDNPDWKWDGGKVTIETAKLHFYNFYVGIKSGDTLVGKLELPNAVQSAWEALSDVAGTSHTQGIVLGYGDNKNINFDFDFRSNKATNGASDATYLYLGADGNFYTSEADVEAASTTVVQKFELTAAADGTADYYTNDYGLAAEFKLLDSNEFVNGLEATVGGAFQINEKALGAAASAGYKLALNDTFYVKPVVGWTMDADLSAQKINDMKLAGGLVFGWGDEKDANAGVPYVDSDDAHKKVTPGVGVNVLVPLAENPTIVIVPSFYSGSIVENLTAAAVAQIALPSGSDAEIAVAGGLKYAIAATDAVTVTPYVGARFATKGYANAAKAALNYANTDNGGVKDTEGADADGLLNLKAGLDVAGLINNTTFSVWYQSRNMMQTADGAAKIGTINVQCKISF